MKKISFFKIFHDFTKFCQSPLKNWENFRRSPCIKSLFTIPITLLYNFNVTFLFNFSGYIGKNLWKMEILLYFVQEAFFSKISKFSQCHMKNWEKIWHKFFVWWAFRVSNWLPPIFSMRSFFSFSNYFVKIWEKIEKILLQISDFNKILSISSEKLGTASTLPLHRKLVYNPNNIALKF